MTNTSVHIEDDGFWHGAGDVHVRGHAFRDGELYRPPDLLALVEDTPVAGFERLVGELDGFYSIVRATDEAVCLAVDHVRSYPLFYATTDDGVYVSNDAHWIKARLPAPRVDPIAEFEFLLTGVVTGRDTLYPEIKQLEAGELAVVDAAGAPTVSTRRHHRFEPRPPRAATEDELLAELDAVLEGAFRRLVEVADGREIVVSLSGGPDSRLLACMLRRLDYEHWSAFTYGQEDNWDSAVAAEVADALDVPLTVVPYDHDMWREWFHSDERVDYYRYAFNFDAPPAIGAVPAVGELRRRGAIDDDAIVLCGNLFPSRYDYPPELRRLDAITEDDLVELVLERYYARWEWDDAEAEAAFRSRLRPQLDPVGGDSLTEALAVYKDWRVRNRNAKLMIMPEEYAFWGYDSWTPLWDAEYVRFWEGVPVRFLDGKRLHRTYVDRLYRELTGVDRPPASHESVGPIKRLEKRIAGSSLDRVIRPIYERLEAPYKKLTMESPYTREPAGTLGIMPEAQFEALCSSYGQDVHPFKTLEIVGCVSFDPPENPAGPVDGVLDLDRLRTATHAAHRESLPWFTGEAPDEVLPEPSPRLSG